MIIDPGQLDRPITIQRATLVSGTWDDSEVWADYLSAWAMLKRAGEDEEFAAGQTYERRIATFVMNFTADIRATDRIVSEGVTWRILGIGEIGLKHGLEIKVEVLSP